MNLVGEGKEWFGGAGDAKIYASGEGGECGGGGECEQRGGDEL